MKKVHDIDSLEELAYILAREVEQKIKNLNLPGAEYRRNFDGVSQDAYLLAKMIGEILELGRPRLVGFVLCTDENKDTDEIPF